MDQLKLGLNRTATESLAQDLAACLVELDEIDANVRRLLVGLEDARFNWSPGARAGPSPSVWRIWISSAAPTSRFWIKPWRERAPRTCSRKLPFITDF
ncbi:MAG: hypothetical protein DMG57_37230 [Acidobacteria bacterium]|nr:MAG: hypothetical protein DMG57_37230 [Acidobacteriota bacterium]